VFSVVVLVVVVVIRVLDAFFVSTMTVPELIEFIASSQIQNILE
jgi:hypothetical protein